MALTLGTSTARFSSLVAQAREVPDRGAAQYREALVGGSSRIKFRCSLKPSRQLKAYEKFWQTSAAGQTEQSWEEPGIEGHRWA